MSESGIFQTEYERVCGVLIDGRTVEITTPTMKEIKAYHSPEGFVLVEDSGYSHAGEGARSRLKKILKAKGTEWSLKGESERAGNKHEPEESTNGN